MGILKPFYACAVVRRAASLIKNALELFPNAATMLPRADVMENDMGMAPNSKNLDCLWVLV